MKDVVQNALSLFCLIACCPCCFPCYVCLIRSNRRCGTRRRNAMELAGWESNPVSPTDVHPLPSRKRRLSIPSSAEPSLAPDQKTAGQSQSAFFAKLPLELRSQIYKEVLGDFSLYLFISMKKLRHIKIDRHEAKEDLAARRYQQPGPSLLPLLLTCRRIYSESISYLYSSNKFSTEPDTILSLTSSIRLSRFNTISQISFSCSVANYPEDFDGTRDSLGVLWERTCIVLASMKGLRDLQVNLWPAAVGIIGPGWERESVKMMLGMLCIIKQPTNFEVKIESQEVDGYEIFKDAPFKLTWSPGLILIDEI
ncbi:hypothetical protein EJ06DRAFT_531412 [Trichodelitschia bisporula]|uniref:DUF7730 domain-containing protein n=1 Tax=Trichodelitschia bisporula TaxID=703511 RepID=A0A6G1HSV1_9PEZI|nr:hypothetical protein EJ06DRAFT_531412 [Trichodelitschia bisporula]